MTITIEQVQAERDETYEMLETSQQEVKELTAQVEDLTARLTATTEQLMASKLSEAQMRGYIERCREADPINKIKELLATT